MKFSFFRKRSGGENDHRSEPNVIVYASKSGNAKLVAKETQRYLEKKGQYFAVKNISKLRENALTKTNVLLAIISTDGEGEPTPSANKIFSFLENHQEIDLSLLKYSVCALGDSSYENYCEAGKVFDQYLKKLNANPIFPRVECDSDFTGESIKWIKGVSGVLSSNGQEATADPELNPEIENKHELEAELIEKKQINSNSHKPCFHLVLRPNSANFSLLPGDSIEIKPTNPGWLVEKIQELVPSDKNNNTHDFLLHKAEITNLSKTTLKKYIEIAGNESLNTILNNDKKLTEYLSCANFYDVLCDYPPTTHNFQLNQILSTIKPRLYSIANSPQYSNNHIYLTIKTLRYSFLDRKHEGAGSVYTTEGLSVGDKITLHVCPNLDFHFPNEPETPVIMIGVGTGIAPYRAFLHERAEKQIKGKTWLIFGERNKESDFLYVDDILEFQKNEILNKLSLAFSRDIGKKVYVQDIVLNEQKTVSEWINDDAHIFVCGSRKMGSSIEQAIQQIFKNGLVQNFANWEEFKYSDKYHLDVY